MRDDIRRAHDGIDGRVLRKESHHSLIPALRREIRDPPRHVVRVETGFPQGFLQPFAPAIARRSVFLEDADVGESLSALPDHPLHHFAHAVPVIGIDTVQTVELLARDHERQRTILKGEPLDVAERRSHEDNARDAVALHQVQVLQFPVLPRIGVAEQRQIILFQELSGDPIHHLVGRLRKDPRQDDAHLADFAGPHRLGHKVRTEPRLFDRAGDLFSLFFTKRSSVKIPAYGGG